QAGIAHRAPRARRLPRRSPRGSLREPADGRPRSRPDRALSAARAEPDHPDQGRRLRRGVRTAPPGGLLGQQRASAVSRLWPAAPFRRSLRQGARRRVGRGEIRTVRADLVPGAVFPDLTLPDHTGTDRSLSEIAGEQPLVLGFFRGWW